MVVGGEDMGHPVGIINNADLGLQAPGLQDLVGRCFPGFAILPEPGEGA
jgi:hypothetical protein